MGAGTFKPRETELEVSHARTERLYVKLAVGSFVGIALLIALIWGGHKVYVRWQERQLVRSAVQALERGDDATAGLALRAVLELKPSSLLAARLLAELAEKSGNRAALDWRRKVVELAPDSVDDALALARSAVQFNDVAIAEKALAKIDEKDRRRADYHAAAALLAQARQQNDEAEREWTLAVQLAPEEKAYQLEVGVLHLRSRNEDRHRAGEAMLEGLRNDPKHRAAATRALINDGLARQANARTLLQLVTELQAYPDATFSDRLLYLGFLHQVDDSHFASALTDLEKRAGQTPVDLATLLNWMSQNNLSLLALDFLKTLPRQALEQWPVPLAIADIYARLKDWTKLEDATKGTNWQQFDFLRHAYLTQALRAQDKAVAAEREWREAVKSASGQNESLLSLARVASEWNWQKEALDLLWQLSKNADSQSEALHTLYSYYAKLDDTQGLYRVLLRLFDMDPADLKVQNNLAQVALLLDADRERAAKLAADLYKKDPSNVAFTTTYAYSLYRKGDPNGAIRVMADLKKEQLRDPAVAAYYGVFLTAAGDKAGAQQYLDLGEKAHLLPEEKALLKKARAQMPEVSDQLSEVRKRN